MDRTFNQTCSHLEDLCLFVCFFYFIFFIFNVCKEILLQSPFKSLKYLHIMVSIRMCDDIHDHVGSTVTLVMICSVSVVMENIFMAVFVRHRGAK